MNDNITRLGLRDRHGVYSGQVILDSAAVVKELVENALDAGSTRVEVRVRGLAGLKSVIVTDNGSGISSKDLSLLCKANATSKIHSFGDVSALRTMGFRGEALSAIAALAGKLNPLPPSVPFPLSITRKKCTKEVKRF